MKNIELKLRQDRFFILTSILIISYISIFSYICFLKLVTFSYDDWDLAIYSNFFYNVLKGNFFSSLTGLNFFGIHLHITLLLIVPIFALFSHPYTLLFLQTLFLGLAAIPLYFIVKKKLNAAVALLFVILYLVYPGVAFTNLNEFHPESFFPFLLLCTFYYWIKGNARPFLIFAFLSLMLKENFSLVIFMLGLYCMFEHKNKFGTILLATSLLWFYLAFFVILPALNKGMVGYLYSYPYFGSQPLQIIKNIILHPLFALKIMFMKEKIRYLFALFAPLCFLSFLNPKTLMLSLPLFLQHLLSIRTTEYNITLYYSAELMPILLVSSVYGLKFLLRNLGMQAKKIVIVAIFVTGLLLGLSSGPLLYLKYYIMRLKADYLDMEKARLVKLIPSQSPVVATFQFMPRLSARRELYSFHFVYIGYIAGNIKYNLPDTVEYALIDLNDRMNFNDFYDINNYKNLQSFFLGNEWGLIDYIDTIILLKKEAGSRFNLCRRLKKSPKGTRYNTSIIVDNAIELIGYKMSIHTEFQNNYLDIDFYWRCLEKTEKDINMIIDIIDEYDNLIVRKLLPICYRIFPTNSWKKNELFQEASHLKIPFARSLGKYKLKIVFYDYRNGLVCSTNRPVDNLGRVSFH